MFTTLCHPLLDMLFPVRCLGCQRYDYWICPTCRQRWPRLKGALGFYRDPVLKHAIHLMKYQGYKGIAVELGQALAARVPSESYDLVMPIPLHWRRRWKRGYNQTVLLAKQFPKPLWPALRKIKSTHTQAGLQRAARLDNLREAFAIIPSLQPRLRGQRILLIDDVYSTGATTAACTKELLDAGVQSVQVAVVALNLKKT